VATVKSLPIRGAGGAPDGVRPALVRTCVEPVKVSSE
jgi:hypothetical protein